MYPTQFDETIPGRVSSSWTPQQGLSRPPNQTTGPAEESKRTKRVQGWSRQIGLGTLFAIHTQIVFKIIFVVYVGVNLFNHQLTLHNVI